VTEPQVVAESIAWRIALIGLSTPASAVLLLYSTNIKRNIIEQDRQYTCNRNIEARSRNQSCSGKAISITYSECLSVALRKADAPYYIAIRGLSGSIIFFHIISKRHEFRKNSTGYKMCFYFLYNYVWKFFPSKKNRAQYYHKSAYVFT
jgi:hypothetical protein